MNIPTSDCHRGTCQYGGDYRGQRPGHSLATNAPQLVAIAPHGQIDIPSPPVMESAVLYCGSACLCAIE